MQDERTGEHRFGADGFGGPAPGWYPDPGGRHDLRYYNGVRWTGDVATDGRRYVAPLTPTPDGPHPPGARGGMFALVAGVVALAIAWIPFVFVVGAILAVLAIVAGLRARREPSQRGPAVAGIVTGGTALLLAAGGCWLSVVVIQEVRRFNGVGEYEAVVNQCEEVDGSTRAVGTITNLDDDRHSYVVTVQFTPDRTAWIQVDDVGPGEVREFTVEDDFVVGSLDCAVTDVTGPFPFGVEVES